MLSSANDLQIIETWLAGRASAHTQSCYRRDVARLLAHIGKLLSRISLGDLQGFAQTLIASGLAPISRARTIAAVKSLFGFCCRMRHLPSNPAAELALPRYEKRLAERIVGEEDVRRMLVVQQRPRDHTLLRRLYTAGLRVSDLRFAHGGTCRRGGGRRSDHHVLSRTRSRSPRPGCLMA